MENTFRSPRSCQECFVADYTDGENMLIMQGCCHTKYGHAVTCGGHIWKCLETEDGGCVWGLWGEQSPEIETVKPICEF